MTVHASPPRTVLFADGLVAQPTMEALLGAGWVAGLVTPRASVEASPLRLLARHQSVPVLDVTRADLAAGIDTWLQTCRPDLVLSIAFPYRIPASLIAMPPLGAFNVHGGRLPRYRGPQPVFWQLVNQESEGAVAVHLMDEAFDRGPVAVSHPIPIDPDDTHGLHTVRVAFAAVAAVRALCAALLQFGRRLPLEPQEEAAAGFQRRPAYDDLVIRWDQHTGRDIRARVKAGNPWNHGAFTSLKGVDLRLTDVTLIEGAGRPSAAPGEVLAVHAADGVLINCRDGSALRADVISLREGLLPGRALAAFGVTAGDCFTPPVSTGPDAGARGPATPPRAS